MTKLLEYTSNGEWGPSVNQDRAQWQSFLEKLVPFPLVRTPNGTMIYADAVTVDGSELGWASNADYAISRYAAVFPAQLVGLDSSTEDKQTAWDSVQILNDAINWLSSGGFDMNMPAASRTVPQDLVGWLLTKYTSLINQTIGPNGYTESGQGGAGLESIGGLEGIHTLMLQSHEGVLRIFPRWPKGEQYTASFSTLRANGAFLVSAAWDGIAGAVKEPVSVLSEAGGECIFENPFQNSVCVLNEVTKAKVVTRIRSPNSYVSFDAVTGAQYSLAPC